MSRLGFFSIALILFIIGCGHKRIEIVTPEKRTTGTIKSLYTAIEEGNIEMVQLLVAHGADVNIKDDWDGASPLHKAIETGRKDMMELLIASGADIEAKKDDGETPLHRAAYEGRKDMVEFLIVKSAEINAKDKEGCTPLHKAVVGEFIQVLDVDFNDVNEIRESEDKLRIEIIELLVNKGADVNASDEYGCTPLLSAIIWNQAVLVEFLVEHGADVNKKLEDNNTTPLHCAISNASADIVKILIVNGANVNAKDEDGQTPLHQTAWEDYKDTAELLIAKGADVNSIDRNGDTPLHVAALNRHKELYDLLIEKGGDTNVKNKQGKTPVDYVYSQPPKYAQILSDDDTRPYSVIITNLKVIRRFLRSQMIDFDQIWFPEKADIERLGTVLKSYLEKKTPVNTKTWFDRDYILANLNGYNREYAGYFKNGAKYVICNLFRGIDSDPQDNMFTNGIYDGGCDFIRVVFDLNSRKVTRIDCNGM